MRIYKYDVPNELILRYCKIIILMKNEYSSYLERARSEVHNEIFDYVGCNRSLDKREDRKFFLALETIVGELTI